jgi:hypothetical protein
MLPACTPVGAQRFRILLLVTLAHRIPLCSPCVAKALQNQIDLPDEKPRTVELKRYDIRLQVPRAQRERVGSDQSPRWACSPAYSVKPADREHGVRPL